MRFESFVKYFHLFCLCLLVRLAHCCFVRRFCCGGYYSIRWLLLVSICLRGFVVDFLAPLVSNRGVRHPARVRTSWKVDRKFIELIYSSISWFNGIFPPAPTPTHFPQKQKRNVDAYVRQKLNQWREWNLWNGFYVWVYALAIIFVTAFLFARREIFCTRSFFLLNYSSHQNFINERKNRTRKTQLKSFDIRERSCSSYSNQLL